jgi:D-galactarolactone cycloisomerase
LGWPNFWIEPAYWDIKGKAEGRPVYELLGGSARQVEIYCSTGGLHRVEGWAGQFLAVKQRDFATAKLRVRSATLEDDITLFEAIRKEVGES